MDSILSSWVRLFRFIILIIVIALFAIYLIKNAFGRSTISLEFGDNKTLIKVKSDDKTISQSIIAASDCWQNTGIVVKPGESYTIKVTGKIHTAADYLIRDVANDTIPQFTWSGPEGREFRVRGNTLFEKYDRLRQSNLIEPKANIGALLFYLQGEEDSIPSCEGGHNFIPRPKNLIAYDNNRGIFKGKNTTSSAQFLWASVNDMLVMDSSENSKQAYLGGDLKGDTLLKKLNKWEYIKKSDYRKFWFDDNIGNYIISAEITD